MNIYKLLLFALTIVSHYTYCSDVIEHPIKYKLIKYKSSFTIEAHTETEQQIGSITCIFSVKKSESEIISLNIDNNHQNRGIGTQLMLKALQKIKAKKIREICWFSTIEAISFYKRFGAKYCPNRDNATNFEFIFERDGDPEENLKKYREKSNSEDKTC